MGEVLIAGRKVDINMEEITKHSIERASEEAVKHWVLSSSQYPFQNKLIQKHINITIIEVVSTFALNVRRSMEILSPKVKYPLSATRWKWKPTKDGEIVAGLRATLNRIIHARKLYVGFEHMSEKESVIEGGAIIVPYIKAETDRTELAFIDLFALSYAFLYGALPCLNKVKNA